MDVTGPGVRNHGCADSRPYRLAERRARIKVPLTIAIAVLFLSTKPVIPVLIHGRMAIMKVRICPACGERWWCVKCGYCHLCHPDFDPPAGVAVMPRGGSPTLPSRAVAVLC
jgi:hypothetical protein